jgi:ABC-type polysaccharide/polyol phosphate transport system ATPase subunit
MVMTNETAIKVTGLSKSFKIPHDNRYTLKERIFYLGKKMSYEKFTILDNISFTINRGDFFGIIGRNGSGKSTLLKILAGIYTPDNGIIEINDEISPFLELGVGFSPELSGRDNIFLNGIILGLSHNEIKKKFDSIVEFSELDRFIDQKLKNYSSGMYVRLAFSIAIAANKEILLMDEVLAVGDYYFQQKCLNELNKLKEAGKTIVLVSHDVDAIKEHCNKAILLKRGKIAHAGDPESVVSDYMAAKK